MNEIKEIENRALLEALNDRRQLQAKTLLAGYLKVREEVIVPELEEIEEWDIQYNQEPELNPDR